MLICENCGTCGEEDAVMKDKYGTVLCQHCFEARMEAYINEKNIERNN